MARGWKAPAACGAAGLLIGACAGMSAVCVMLEGVVESQERAQRRLDSQLARNFFAADIRTREWEELRRRVSGGARRCRQVTPMLSPDYTRLDAFKAVQGWMQDIEYPKC